MREGKVVTTEAAPAPAKGRPAAENPKNVVQSAAKVFAVLKAFGPDLPELTLAEVAARAGTDRGTAFRLIHTLEALGYLRAVPASRRFRLTLKCLELGFSALAARGMPDHAAPLLRELVPEFGDAASLGAVEAGEVVYLARVQAGLERHGVVRHPGTRVGAYATALGHAMLAFLPREEQVAQLERKERVKLSERTITDLDALLERLAEVRARGFAVSDGENAYGLRTVAAPILDASGQPFAGVSLTIDASRAPLEDFVAAGLPRLRQVVTELTEATRLSLGAIGPRLA
ncbi:helix-turn-helix domain-containing protein [Roseomonas aerophila]|uniref:Helix-turn-helix domain-containing protein n=1 Tax=Teichococcus aerophilus TaxID=1224513 RepID=A0ABR7RIS8_9PROT|nr:IclR family transcriptional regulator C-terminal domain-containing protein [Pseudoroseomonas aerophila]MBC9206333.1 helix-turn-helix domain-containing protein [Pseudoroseomonas aerophila]